MKHVYFIRPVTMAGPIKIGCSTLPSARLLSLSTWSPFPLEIAAVVEGDFALERRIHARFARSLSHREWFHPTAEVLAAVAGLRSGLPIEQAIDFTAYSGDLPSRKRQWSPSRRLYISYLHKLRHAERRAGVATEGLRRIMPEVVSEILDRWGRSDIAPTPLEISLLDDVIRDPPAHCVSVDVRYPPRARAS